MKPLENGLLCVIGLLAALCAPAYATVQIVSMRPSRTSPQLIGTSIIWTAKATDSNSGLLTFQFNVAPPGGRLSMARDFNVGTLSAGTWTSQPFVWTPTGVEGVYRIQVVIKDFTSGENTSMTVNFQVIPLVTGSTPVAVATANPLVALFSAPSCASGSSLRVVFRQQSKATPAAATNWVKCHPPASMTVEIAGMYPSTTYDMFSQTNTGGVITNGPTVSFTTGALPAGVPFPTFQVNIPAGSQADSTDSVVLVNLVKLEGFVLTAYIDIATDLSGNIIWYYYANNNYSLLTRLLPNSTFLTIQNGIAWNPATQWQQVLRQIDLAGNIVRETNTGVIQQQLLALGAIDAQPCNAIPSPAPVDAACLGAFHHDAIQTLPGGYTAVLADVEKIFPPGTQGDTSGLPVDIVGDMIIVLNANWQVVWYFDSFQHDSGPPQLDINRPAVLGETCGKSQTGCPPILLLGTGIAPSAKDWLHANSLYYRPQSGDIIWSSRSQDWVMKIDYNNGAGTGDILWRMGPGGDFVFNNVNNDTYPWFSGQHDAGMENNGAGPMTLFDNGNTRVSQLGSGNSRCMVLTVDETNMQVTPLVPSMDLGVFSTAMGSAQLLSGNHYYCFAAIVVITLSNQQSYSIESSGTTQVLNIQGPEGYRGWRMPSLYQPPTT